MDVTVRLNVNGVDKTITTDSQRRLLDVLREEFHLTGTKYGCGEGQCGACAVLVNGKRLLSCISPITVAEGESITTIEGLAQGDSLHEVQEAFLEEEAMQCGYCTSGMILSAVALLQKNPNPSEDEIAAGMNGHLCRCNGYIKIVKAVKRASSAMRGESHA
ncbi:MAG TPA: (2Fe-2S)-binding protein [Acidobacteriota bacterium]|nr:(2Fe-2S)-binding protein [Acidobacteriota bacterium]